MLNKIEKDILLQVGDEGLSLSSRPFLDIASKFGTTEEEVLKVLKELSQRNIIKKLRAVLNHRRAGYDINILTAWKVDDDTLMRVKDIFIKKDMVSHCYQREAHKEFDFNLYTMMHSSTEKDIIEFVDSVAKDFNIEYQILKTDKELKKEKINLRELL